MDLNPLVKLHKTALFLLAILLFSCSGKVVQYVSSRASFDKYQSYYLITLKGTNLDSDNQRGENIEKLERAFQSEMSRRDYQTNSQSPDLILRYEVISTTETNNNNNIQDPYGFNRYDPYQRQSFGTSSYISAMLLVELTDAKTKKLVWQASLDLKNHLKKNKKKDPIGEAAIELFNTYLYRAGSSQVDQSLKIQ